MPNIDIDAFIEETVQTTVNRLLAEQDYITLSRYAFAINGFEPAMIILRAEIKEAHALSQQEITTGVQTAFITKQLEDIRSKMGALAAQNLLLAKQHKTLGEEYKRLLNHVEEGGQKPPATREPDFANVMASLKASSQLYARLTAIPREQQSLAEQIATNQQQELSLAASLKACITAVQQNTFELALLSPNDGVLYQKELQQRLLALRERSNQSEKGFAQRSHTAFLDALEQKLTDTNEFEQRSNLLLMIQSLRQYSNARSAYETKQVEVQQQRSKRLHQEALIADEKDNSVNYSNYISHYEREAERIAHVKRQQTALADEHLTNQKFYQNLARLALATALALFVIIMVATLSIEVTVLSVLAIPVLLFASLILSAIESNARDSHRSAQQSALEASKSVDTCQNHVRENTENRAKVAHTISALEQQLSQMSSEIKETSIEANLILEGANQHLQKARFFSCLPKEEADKCTEEFRFNKN